MRSDSDILTEVVQDHVYLASRTPLAEGELPAAALSRGQFHSILSSTAEAGYGVGMERARQASITIEELERKISRLEGRDASPFRYLPSKYQFFGLMALCGGIAAIVDEMSHADGFVIFWALAAMALGLWMTGRSLGSKT